MATRNDHPVLEVLRDVVSAASPHVPAGHKWIAIVQAPDGVITFAGNVDRGDMFAVLATASVRVLENDPGGVRVMRMHGGRGNA